MALRGKSLIAAGFWGDIMITLARHAMATRFELVLHGDDEVPLRAAADAAFDEIERLDEQLSFFRPTSEVAAVNRWAAEQPIKLEAAPGRPASALPGDLDRDRRSLRPDHRADHAAAAAARGRLAVDAARPGGGPWRRGLRGGRHRSRRGHGAVHEAGDGAGPGRRGPWLRDRPRHRDPGRARRHLGAAARRDQQRARDRHAAGEAAWSVGWDAPAGSHAGHRELSLVDQAVSVSGQQARSDGGALVPEGHVRDPRTGDLVAHTLAAGVIGPSSLMCDMLSTALLVGGASWLETLSTRFPGYTGWVAEPAMARRLMNGTDPCCLSG